LEIGESRTCMTSRAHREDGDALTLDELECALGLK